MFRCDKPAKRKSSGWRKAMCMRANKSIHHTLDSDDIASPSKLLRLSTQDHATRLPAIQEFLYEEIPDSFHEENKENICEKSVPRYFVNTSSKNNLYPIDYKSVSGVFSHQKSIVNYTETSSGFYYEETESETTESITSRQDSSRCNPVGEAQVAVEYRPLAPRSSSCPVMTRESPVHSSSRPLFTEKLVKPLVSLSGTHGDSAYRSGISMTLDDSDLATEATRLLTVDSGFTSRLGLPGSLAKGQLRLSVTQTGPKQITIHVMDIYGVTSMSSDNTYVQTMLVPDMNKKSLRESRVASSKCTSPQESKIIYDLASSDDSKRLMISVNNKDKETSCDQLVGCMSFGVKHLLSKSKKKAPVDDWYYLLPEKIGQRKHLMVPRANTVTRQQGVENTAYANCENSTQLAQKLHGSENFKVVIRKCASGYGFTIKGEMPVRVGRVKPGGAAEKLGLLRGDYILSLNNTDTKLSDAETVANMVRDAKNQIILDIARPRKSSRNKSQSSCRSPASSQSLEGSTTRPNTPEGCHFSTPDGASACLSVAEKVSNWGADLSKGMLGDLSDHWQPELSMVPEEKTTDFTSSKILSRRETPSSQKWNPDLSCITRFDESHRFFNSAILEEVSEDIYEEINPADVASVKTGSSWNSTTEESETSCEPHTYTDTDNTTIHHNTLATSTYRSDLEKTMSYAKSGKNSWLPVIQDESRNCGPFSSEESSLEESRQQKQDSSYEAEMSSIAGRETAIQQLLIIEQDFTRLMKRGIQRFSRPLRHQILTRSQHAILFQNIEKLVALSEFHIRQMLEKSYCAEDSYITANNDVTSDSVGSIYVQKVRMLCQAYHMYYEGLGEAMYLLESLRQDPHFYKFLQRIENLRGFEMTLSEFIQQPLTHFQQLVGSVGRVLLTTSPHHHDYNNIRTVMEVIHQSVSMKSPDNTVSSYQSNQSTQRHSNSSLATSTRSQHRNSRRRAQQMMTSSHNDHRTSSEDIYF